MPAFFIAIVSGLDCINATEKDLFVLREELPNALPKVLKRALRNSLHIGHSESDKLRVLEAIEELAPLALSILGPVPVA
jgi:hypothetical protein